MRGEARFKVLVAGGGPAAIEAILTLREVAPRLEAELLAPHTHLVSRPLSVLEPFARPGARRYPLSHLAGPRVTVRPGVLTGVDPDRRLAATDSGERLHYDALLLAIGARTEAPIPDALTFGGQDDVERVRRMLQALEAKCLQTAVFVATVGAGWTLPLYELALRTAERARERRLDRLQVAVVSPEARPLEIFGEAASDLVESLLAERGVAFVSGEVVPTADRLVALPVQRGRTVDGLPAGSDGFLEVDECGRLAGAERVWAAGDVIDYPIKQGGLAAQQAEVAARSIAATAGCSVETTPFEPVLRAMLVAGRRAWFLRRRLDGRDPGQASSRALWWPPSKIAGPRLAPALDRLDTEGQRPRIEPELEPARRPVRRLVITPDATRRLS